MKKADPFYQSKAWRRLSARVLKEEPLCRRCLVLGIQSRSEQVHHILSREDRPDLELDRDNLVGLCRHCHLLADAEIDRKKRDDQPLTLEVEVRRPNDNQRHDRGQQP